jgi:hypothetical protein
MTVHLTPSAWRCLAVITANPGLTRLEIAEKAYVAAYTVKNDSLRQLTKEKLVHISGWKVGRCGKWAALYEAGEGESAAKPPSQREIQRQKKAVVTLPKAVFDPIMAALMGVGA